MLTKFALATGLVVASALPATRALHADSAPSIQTVFASYGYGADRKDVKDDVVKDCDGKPSCKILVKNESFTVSKGPADPSPGNDKGLMVSWKCGDVSPKIKCSIRGALEPHADLLEARAEHVAFFFERVVNGPRLLNDVLFAHQRDRRTLQRFASAAVEK